MKQWLKELFQSIWQGTVRIFGPNEDNYPQTGVQPYEGETGTEQLDSYEYEA